MLLFGIDLGGDKIEGVAIDSTAPERPVCRLRVPTEAARGYAHVLGQFAKLIGEMEQACGQGRPATIGFGIPGGVDPASGFANIFGGVSLRHDVQAALGVRAQLDNDANCFALAESRIGSARGRNVVFGAVLGSGVGGGIILRGQPWSGLNGIAGEWGHNPIPGADAPCSSCGRKGCADAVISGPALERFYAAQGGQKARLAEIEERSRGGDGAAVATLERLREAFARAMGAVINLLDPDAIVIGGGVGNLELLYSAETRAALGRHVLKPNFRTEILRPSLGDSAGSFGAALLTL